MDNKTIVSLFLSEIIRSRNTPIPRMAEISGDVVEAMQKLRDDETEMLCLLRQLEKDFQGAVALKQTLHAGHSRNEVRIFDQEIREYAAELFKTNLVASAAFLRDAADCASMDKLCRQYPEFNQFLNAKTDKAPLLKGLLAG